MNYIRHLNAFFSFIRSDGRLTSSHVSLYMALFQYWNFNRFQNPFPVYRDNIMKLSKIGSKNTYHKCVKELHEAKYIYYHPQASKFQPGRVSMARLDVQEEEVSRYKQLDLFNTANNPTEASPPLSEGDLGGGKSAGLSTDFGTKRVPILTATSTDIDTVPVPKMGHNIKPNFKENKTVSNTPTKIFYKNEKQSQQTDQPGVPNSVHMESGAERSRSIEAGNTERSRSMPSINEVETFFTQNNYPITEAQKFFLYNQGRGWMIRDKVPIKDWQALAHKWMLGIGKNNEQKKQSLETGPDAEELFKQFSNGQKIFNLITVAHFPQLQLELTEVIMQEAWQERINQLTGSNQNSILQLLQAYMSGNQNNELIAIDNQNLINLAKRIAVLKHFQQRNP